MPYLDFELNQNRVEMAAKIDWMKENSATLSSNTPLSSNRGSPDEKLIKGYLRTFAGWPTPPLHIRRTLDQFFYTDLVETNARDEDQVIFRYTAKNSPDRIKLFMVDQLWLWVLDSGMRFLKYDILSSYVT